MDLEKLKKLIEGKVEKINIRIDSINYEKEGSNNFLRIIIDKDGIVDIDDCVEATRIINKLLDDDDTINESYILDVSSKERGKNNG